MYISVATFLFLLSVFMYRVSARGRLVSLLFVMLVPCEVALSLLYIASDHYTGEGITNATLYLLRYGFSGVGLAHILFIFFSVLCFVAVSSLLLWWIYSGNTTKKGGALRTYVSLLALTLSLALHPAIHDLYRLHADPTTPQDDIHGPAFLDHYRSPSISKIGEARNLVFVYVESLEETYSSDAFPGLTPGLSSLASRGLRFTNIGQVFGANFTIAGFVATQCGIPLVGPAYGNSMSGMDTYLPTVSCLGDLLRNAGYHMAYYGGARKGFAGKDLFLTTHGFHDVNGLAELLPELEDRSYANKWGLYDDTTLDLAYDRFVELSGTKTPFALFVLTLDTHLPDGSPSASCKDIRYEGGREPRLDAVACSDHLVSQFIEKILSSPTATSTVVVIASDHLAPFNPTKKLPVPPKRSNRLMIFAPGEGGRTAHMLGSTLDVTPTILPFLGYSGEIGLGRNLLDPLYSESEIKTIQKSIPNWASSIALFWDFPTIRGPVHIDTESETIEITGRTFKIPILVELDENLNTTLRFEFDLEYDTSEKKSERDLISMVKKNTTTPFILVNVCEEMQELTTESPENGYCVATKNGVGYTVAPIHGMYTLTMNTLSCIARGRNNSTC